MAIKELPVNPQVTYSVGQGMVGTRKWSLDYGDDIDGFIAVVAASHWPGWRDCFPVQIQAGGLWDGVVALRNCNTNPRTYEDLGGPPTYNSYIVTATYALHRASNCWPARTPKPWHPPGTTLELKVRGTGQMLLVTPASMKHMLTTDCGTSDYQKLYEALSATVGVRLVVPVTEYHLSCDRMTLKQVNQAMGQDEDTARFARDWDEYQGAVNCTNFLGAYKETLMFDGYEINETYVADPVDPVRYRMTACFKNRVILAESGSPQRDDAGRTVGWNHDFINSPKGQKIWGWTYIVLRQQDGKCKPRYHPTDFSNLFGCNATQACGVPESTSKTALNDNDLCGGLKVDLGTSTDWTLCAPPDCGSLGSDGVDSTGSL